MTVEAHEQVETQAVVATIGPPNALQVRTANGWIRVASHLVVWATVLIPVITVLNKGWIAIGDNAAIASKAFESLSPSPPLTGLVTTASSGIGHILYDPGPLEFWLLAIPVHLDPVHGELWGAALVAGVALSLAIEAAWSIGKAPASAVVALCCTLLLWASPASFENIAWNANFPMTLFLAAVVIGWAVADGRFGWWPLLVAVSSIAAQTHLIYLLPALILSALTPVVGMAITRRMISRRLLLLGFGVFALCWIAPVGQDLFSRSGNLNALASGNSGQHDLGLRYSLHLFGSILGPPPIWTQHQPGSFTALLVLVSHGSTLKGVLILCVLLSAAIYAARSGHRLLASLSLACLLASAGFIAGFAIFPVKNINSLLYLDVVLWLIGLMCWIVSMWFLAEVARSLLRRSSWHSAVSTVPPESSRITGSSTVLAIVALASSALVMLGSVRAVIALKPAESTVSWNRYDVDVVRAVSAAIEKEVTPRSIQFEMNGATTDPITWIWISEGVAWRLDADGWTPRVPILLANFMGLRSVGGGSYADVTVTMERDHVSGVTVSSCRGKPTICSRATRR